MEKQIEAVCDLSDLTDGEMNEVKVGETPVLLIRTGKECFAVGAHCTHYGAPLADGAFVEGRIICPWHHACFDASSGDLLEPPALDSLPKFPVTIENGHIFVDVDENKSDHRIPKMVSADTTSDARVFVILGGGAAGYAASQTLREDGFEGRIIMVTKEDKPPYDRPNLSKDYLQQHAEPEWLPLRPQEFYTENSIEILSGKTVARVVNGTGSIEFTESDPLRFDRLLIATGGIPRKIELPGSDLKNIFELRSFESADEIIAASNSAKKIVVIGASFIGMEAAASLKKDGVSVTVVAPDKVPFEKTLGAEIGEMLKRVHEYNGVAFRLVESVESFTGEKSVEGVKLASGQTIPADLVLVGIGVQPATAFLDGFSMHKDKGVIVCDELSAGENVYAAGDITHFPDNQTGDLIRIEHWRTALQQGRTAARNMLDKHQKFNAVPFFWTTQFDATLNYVGHATKWDEIYTIGSISEKDFLAFYINDEKILAVSGMNRDRELDYIEETFRLGRMPSPSEIRKTDNLDDSIKFWEHTFRA